MKSLYVLMKSRRKKFYLVLFRSIINYKQSRFGRTCKPVKMKLWELRLDRAINTTLRQKPVKEHCDMFWKQHPVKLFTTNYPWHKVVQCPSAPSRLPNIYKHDLHQYTTATPSDQETFKTKSQANIHRYNTKHHRQPQTKHGAARQIARNQWWNAFTNKHIDTTTVWQVLSTEPFFTQT